MTDSVKYIEIVATKNMIPRHSIMAPQWVFDKVQRGEEFSVEDIKYCVSMYWSEGQ